MVSRDGRGSRVARGVIRKTLMTTQTQRDPESQVPGLRYPRSALEPGTRAPEFELNTTPDQRVALSAFYGRPVVLVFYPADWSPVCGDQLALYNQLMSEFRKHDAQLLGVSVDGPWCHLAYGKDRNLRFPLLSDFEPKGETAKRYGAYQYGAGVAERALFVLDRGGTIHWSYVSPLGINPGADGILEALESLPEQGGRHGDAARALQ